jgi:hypothetical protein
VRIFFQGKSLAQERSPHRSVAASGEGSDFPGETNRVQSLDPVTLEHHPQLRGLRFQQVSHFLHDIPNCSCIELDQRCWLKCKE